MQKLFKGRMLVMNGKKYFSSFRSKSHDYFGFSQGQMHHNQGAKFSQASDDLSRPFTYSGKNIDDSINSKHFDLAIIGGGSAGLALAYEASKFGLKIIVFDFVEPSYQGTKWGLGGTCVNVGCIPKKLMHTAALHAEHIKYSYDYGWDLKSINDYNNEEVEVKFPIHFSWQKLVKNVQSHIKSLNFGYKGKLMEKQVKYCNALAAFHDNNTLLYSNNKMKLEAALKEGRIPEIGQDVGHIKAKYIVIATGGRPFIPDDRTCLNCRRYSITSDDIFSLKEAPKKTLIVGGGYIALECAGFLSGLGYPVTVMTRGKYLRSFDQDIADMIVTDLQSHNNVNIIPTSLPYEVQKKSDGRLNIKWKNTVDGVIGEDVFDTLLFATGREANTKSLNLDNIGVELDKSNKIKGGNNSERERTNINNIFALGDVLSEVPELTPVAQKSAYLLAKRLSLLKQGNVSQEEYNKFMLDYKGIPTTVFTPLEYSTVGYSEEEAKRVFGEENIEVYHSRFIPLEENLFKKVDKEFVTLKRKAYTKIICNKKDNERVVGFHYLGPNAGEVMQGLAVAYKLGVTKKNLDEVVGIHPTSAEEFINLKVTKASGENYDKDSC